LTVNVPVAVAVTPPTVTLSARAPGCASFGTAHVNCVAVAVLGVTDLLPIVIEFDVFVVLNPVPVIVTTVPAGPDAGEKLVTASAANAEGVASTSRHTEFKATARRPRRPRIRIISPIHELSTTANTNADRHGKTISLFVTAAGCGAALEYLRERRDARGKWTFTQDKLK